MSTILKPVLQNPIQASFRATAEDSYHLHTGNGSRPPSRCNLLKNPATFAILAAGSATTSIFFNKQVSTILNISTGIFAFISAESSCKMAIRLRDVIIKTSGVTYLLLTQIFLNITQSHKPIRGCIDGIFGLITAETVYVNFQLTRSRCVVERMDRNNQLQHIPNTILDSGEHLNRGSEIIGEGDRSLLIADGNEPSSPRTIPLYGNRYIDRVIIIAISSIASSVIGAYGLIKDTGIEKGIGFLGLGFSGGFLTDTALGYMLSIINERRRTAETEQQLILKAQKHRLIIVLKSLSFLSTVVPGVLFGLGRIETNFAASFFHGVYVSMETAAVNSELNTRIELTKTTKKLATAATWAFATLSYAFIGYQMYLFRHIFQDILPLCITATVTPLSYLFASKLDKIDFSHDDSAKKTNTYIFYSKIPILQLLAYGILQQCKEDDQELSEQHTLRQTIYSAIAYTSLSIVEGQYLSNLRSDRTWAERMHAVPAFQFGIGVTSTY